MHHSCRKAAPTALSSLQTQDLFILFLRYRNTPSATWSLCGFHNFTYAQPPPFYFRCFSLFCTLPTSLYKGSISWPPPVSAASCCRWDAKPWPLSSTHNFEHETIRRERRKGESIDRSKLREIVKLKQKESSLKGKVFRESPFLDESNCFVIFTHQSIYFGLSPDPQTLSRRWHYRKAGTSASAQHPQTPGADGR